MPSHIHFGATRGGAAPLPTPETHNADVVLNLSGSGATRTSSPAVTVRNNGSNAETNSKITMCWSTDLTGAILTVCRTATNARVEQSNIVVGVNGVAGPVQLPTFTVNIDAKKLVVKSLNADGPDTDDTISRDNDPACGVQNL